MKTRVNIDGKEFSFDNAVEYINKLKEFLEVYESKKNHDLFSNEKISNAGIRVNEISVVIDANKVKQEEKPIITKSNASVAKPKLTATFPKGVYVITSGKENDKEVIKAADEVYHEKVIQNAQADNSMGHLSRRKKVNYPKFKKLLSSRYVIQKIPDGERLVVSDCGDFFDKQMVFVSGTLSSRGNINFFDNLEILKENIPNVPRAAFISGKGCSCDKVEKESLKLMKMCTDLISSGIVCYELNNEVLREMDNDYGVLDAFNAAEQIVDILRHDGYTPLLCADLDVREKMNNVLSRLEPEHMVKCPVLSRISSRQLDDISDEDDLIVMHPGSEYDQIILTDRTRDYVLKSLNNYNKQKTSTVKAA